MQFLGSMNLAITLFVGIAIASVIGTVLRQNESYQNYIIKFGPFWHEVFKTLGLYDVYASGWFLFALTFLVLSTSVCIIRNAPIMIRSMREFRENIQERSLQNLPNRAQWTVQRPLEQVLARISANLKGLGYRLRIKDHGTHTVLAAMKGASNRAGYLLTHMAIVTICVGGLLDGNLPLKLKALSGHIAIETRDIPVSEVPARSRLPMHNPSFRGNVSIPEGSAVDVAFINIAEGYVVQKLPFVVEVRDFRITHYPNGQPKSFETDLLIHDPKMPTPLRYTIAVNKPLTYDGYTLYQASFGDGGSKLQLKATPLRGPANGERDILELTGVINEDLNLNTLEGPLRLELTDFRRFNIQPTPEGDPSGKSFRDAGPSFTFKLRWPNGLAKEYVNYMYPVTFEARPFYLSGVRSSPAEEFKYLHIPADASGEPGRFLRFQMLLSDDKRLTEITQDTTRRSLAEARIDDTKLQEEVSTAMAQLVEIFRAGGYEALSEYLDANVPEDKRGAAAEAYLKVLDHGLRDIYMAVLEEEGIDTSKEISPEDRQFFEDAVSALSVLHRYGSPFYLQLEDFEHRQATGLLITRTPGKNIVYLGFAMLITGVFLLLYVPHQRVWALIATKGGATHILLAGSRLRHQHDFAKEFVQLRRNLHDAITRT